MKYDPTVLLDTSIPPEATRAPLSILRLHPEADAVPPMTPDEYDAFVADVGSRGVTTPLTVTPLGVVLDGRHRFAAASVLEHETVPVHVADIPEPVQVDYMVRQAVLRRHLTIGQRRDLAAALLREAPEKSDRQVATVVGLSHPTIAAVRSELETAGDVEDISTRTDTLGRVQPAVRADDRWNPGAVMSSVSPEWYTPRHVVDAVLTTMGTIDLDPCAEKAKGIPASAHLTKSDDGLGQPWKGRVYMNPPYGEGIGEWTAKLRREYDARRVTEAIALIPARTETDWWEALAPEHVCLIHGRLRFSDGPTAAPFPSVAVYLGKSPATFVQAFKALGPVYQRVTP